MAGAGGKQLGTFFEGGTGWLTILRALQDGEPKTSEELYRACVEENTELTYGEFTAWMDSLVLRGMVRISS